MSARLAASRRADSKKISVAGTVASAARKSRRAERRFGGKPANRNRSDGRPDNSSAVAGADGPGRQVTGSPRAVASRTSLYPGSEISGRPASATSATDAPPATRSRITVRILSALWS